MPSFVCASWDLLSVFPQKLRQFCKPLLHRIRSNPINTLGDSFGAKFLKNAVFGHSPAPEGAIEKRPTTDLNYSLLYSCTKFQQNRHTDTGRSHKLTSQLKMEQRNLLTSNFQVEQIIRLNLVPKNVFIDFNSKSFI